MLLFPFMLLSPDRGRGGERGFQAMCVSPSPGLSPYRGRGILTPI
jgi:hypothetical protein